MGTMLMLSNSWFAFILVGLIPSVHGAYIVDKDNYGTGPGSIVFIGDSLTSNWLVFGSSVWECYYSRVAVNKGVAGHKTIDTIKQIQDGALQGLNPNVVVLMIGGNDLISQTHAEAVAQNIRIIVTMLRERLPDSQILLLGLLPADVPQTIIEQGRLVNSIISKYDTSKNYVVGKRRIVQYLDMSHAFGTSEGKPFSELYESDGIHLSAAGYQVWVDTMDLSLRRLLRIQ